METKAHFVAVGGFVLAAVVTLVAVIMWFAGTDYASKEYYETDFTGAVTGLSSGTPVRYNGIDVGRVSELKFDPKDPRIVRVILEIRDDVRIHTDAVASMESQGLAGGSYVLIKGGQPTTPLLKRLPGQEYPVIQSVASSLEQLFASTPMLMARLNIAAERLIRFLDEKNRVRFEQILDNVESITSTVRGRNPQIQQTLDNLAADTRALESMLKNVDAAAVRANAALANINLLAGNLNDVVRNSKPQLAQLTSQGAANLTQLIIEARTMVQAMTKLANSLERNPQRLLTGESRGGYRPQ